MDDAKLEKLLDAFDERSWEVNRKYLIKAAKHLKEIGALPPSDVHRLREMRRMNTSMREITTEMAQALDTDTNDVSAVLAEVVKENDWAARELTAYGGEKIPILENAQLLRILTATDRVLQGSLTNMSHTTIDSSAYRRAIDRSIHAVTTGVADYESVIRENVRELSKEGLRVQYPSGLTRRLDTAVRQNVLDGMRYVNQESMRTLGEEYGADGVEIDAHWMCAEDHLPYQGRQYTIEEFERIQGSLERPFGQWNCRHNIHYIKLGASRNAYTASELREMEDRSTEEITIDGVTKTRYQWSQTMRRLETETRYVNDEAEALKAIGDKKGVREARRRGEELVDAYDKVSRAADIEPQYHRMFTQRLNSRQ